MYVDFQDLVDKLEKVMTLEPFIQKLKAESERLRRIQAVMAAR